MNNRIRHKMFKYKIQTKDEHQLIIVDFLVKFKCSNWLRLRKSINRSLICRLIGLSIWNFFMKEYKPITRSRNMWRRKKLMKEYKPVRVGFLVKFKCLNWLQLWNSINQFSISRSIGSSIWILFKIVQIDINGSSLIRSVWIKQLDFSTYHTHF